MALTALIACGDDEGDGSTTGGTGGTTGGSGGESGTSGGDGGTTGGTGGATGGTGGMTGGMGGMGGIMAPTCTEEIPTTAVMCGGTACPMPTLLMGIDTCSRPCCVTVNGAEACGSKSTIEGNESECAPPPVPDERCPDYMQGAMVREGCCTVDNTCGIVSTLVNMCVTESPFVPDLPQPPIGCDDGAGDDAGM